MEYADFFKTNGYVILPNYFTNDEVLQLQVICDNTTVAMGETWEHQEYAYRH